MCESAGSHLWEEGGKYHFVDVGIDFIWGNVAIFFQQLAGSGIELPIKVFEIPAILL